MKQLTKLVYYSFSLALLIPMIVFGAPQDEEGRYRDLSYSGEEDGNGDNESISKDIIVIHNAPNTLEIGEIFVLEYTIYFTGITDYYSIKSSDPSVVKVTGDNLEGISNGTAAITIKTYNNQTSFIVKVDSIQVESISAEENTRIKFGDQITISTSVYPIDAVDKTLTYESSDENVLTVAENGEVTTVGVGEADVTITAASEVTANVHITVFEITPEKIVTNKESFEIEIREQDTITIELLPADSNNLEYTVQVLDPEIIKIDTAGNITPLKEGETTIEITTWNDIKKIIPVSVYTIPVTKVTIDDSKLNYKSKGKVAIDTPINLSATIVPENATYPDITWYSSDNSVIQIKNNVPKIVGTGSAILTARAESGAEATLSLTIEKDLPMIYIIVFIVLAFILIFIIFVFSIKMNIKIRQNETEN